VGHVCHAAASLEEYFSVESISAILNNEVLNCLTVECGAF
jgi:predicted SAM-dependent methyltransferase